MKIQNCEIAMPKDFYNGIGKNVSLHWFRVLVFFYIDIKTVTCLKHHFINQEKIRLPCTDDAFGLLSGTNN